MIDIALLRKLTEQLCKECENELAVIILILILEIIKHNASKIGAISSITEKLPGYFSYNKYSVKG